MRGQGSPLLRWAFVPAVLVLVAAAVMAVLAVRTQNETAFWVAHTHQVIARLESVWSSLAHAESAQRGYLLTGDASELERFRGATQQVEADLDALARLTVDNPLQQQRLPALRTVALERLQALREAAEFRRQGRLQDALELVRGRGRNLMSEARSQVAALRQEEDRLLQERLQSAEQASHLGMAATAGAGLLAVLLLLSIYGLSMRHASRLVAEQRELQRSREGLRQANEQLQRAATELEQRVEERTVELADINAQLEGFARTVAHDLRAPLRNIQGFAAALLEDETPRLSEQGADYARRLAASAVRLDGMITDLLAYSRLARSHLERERIELEPLVRQLLQELAPDIEQAGAQVSVASPLPAVQAHRGTLQQVLANLVGNALKFVPPGTVPRVEIRARRDGRSVSLTIEDNGLGIEAAHQARIFEVFERLHGQERYPGSGIGLAIVRKGVERMGGRVHLDSQPGKGSRFTVELPSADQAD